MWNGIEISLLNRERIRPRPSWTPFDAGMPSCVRIQRQRWRLGFANGLITQNLEAGLGKVAACARCMVNLRRRPSLHGARLLDAEGGYTTEANSTGGVGRRQRSRRPPGRVVPPRERGDAGGGRGSDHATATLIERQKSLAKAIKLKGQQLDWRGALSALSATDVPPSVQCYTATVAAMAASGRWQEALALLNDMRRVGLVPDKHTYSSAMKACAVADHADEALALLSAMGGGKVGVRPDAFCFNVCISACAKAGLPDRALALLSEMRSEGVMPDVVSFNSVINGLGMAGRWEEALSIMEDMTMEGVMPNSVTYASAINACGQSRQLARALDLLKEARFAGIQVGTSAYNAAIAACGHAGSARDALPLLAEMKKRRVPRTVITYSSLINICGKEGLPDAALELMRQMTEEERIAPNAITYNALVHAVAGGGTSSGGDAKLSSPVDGEEINEKEKEGNGGGEILANQKREGQGRRRVRRWDRVMPLIEEMRAAGHTPDLLSYNLALLASARKGEATKTLQILGDMRRAGFLPTSVGYSAVMSSCERAGNVDQALSVLERMKSGGVQRTLVAFNSALVACAKDGRRAEAVRLLNEMKEEGVSPDEKTFSLTIQACGRAGDATGALLVLRGMLKAGIPPGERAFAATMEAFADRGDVDEVLELMKEARASVIITDSVDGGGRNPCWSCALIASRSCAAAKGDRIEDAIRILHELPADEVSDSAGALPLAGVDAVARKREGGRKGSAWLEALWAAAGTGDVVATVRLAAAAREHGVALTIEHYNRALRTLEAQSRPR